MWFFKSFNLLKIGEKIFCFIYNINKMPSVSPKKKSVCRGRKVELCERKKSCKKTVPGKRRSYCRSRKNKLLKKLMASSAVVVSAIASPVKMGSPVKRVSPVLVAVASPPKKVSRKNRELAGLIGDLNLERGARRAK
jgi:hypothetical protein